MVDKHYTQCSYLKISRVSDLSLTCRNTIAWQYTSHLQNFAGRNIANATRPLPCLDQYDTQTLRFPDGQVLFISSNEKF
jgi:hypothetical protein